MSWDAFYTTGVEVYSLIGQLQMQSGLADSAERAISRAERFRAENQYELAILELERAAEKKPALAKAAHHEALRIRVDWAWPLIKPAQSAPQSPTGNRLSTKTPRDGRLNRSLQCFTYSLTLLVGITYSAATKPDSRRRGNGLKRRLITLHSKPTPIPWPQIATQSSVVTPKPTVTRAYLGR